MSLDFVYTQSNVKTVLYHTNDFSVSTDSMSKTVLLQTIQLRISTQFNCQFFFISRYSVYSNSSISNNSVSQKYAV